MVKLVYPENIETLVNIEESMMIGWAGLRRVEYHSGALGRDISSYKTVLVNPTEWVADLVLGKPQRDKNGYVIYRKVSS